MEMSRILSGLAKLTVGLVIVAVVFALAGVAYGVGFNAAANVAVQPGQPVVVAPYGYGPFWHGGFFGIFFWIIAFFLIFALIRGAFGWGRRGGWGRHGYGPGRMTPGGPDSRWYDERTDRVAEWHRELHRREDAGAPRDKDADTSAGR
jgi:hypothetical protein